MFAKLNLPALSVSSVRLSPGMLTVACCKAFLVEMLLTEPVMLPGAASAAVTLRTVRPRQTPKHATMRKSRADRRRTDGWVFIGIFR